MVYDGVVHCLESPLHVSRHCIVRRPECTQHVSLPMSAQAVGGTGRTL